MGLGLQLLVLEGKGAWSAELALEHLGLGKEILYKNKTNLKKCLKGRKEGKGKENLILIKIVDSVLFCSSWSRSRPYTLHYL